MKFSRASKRRSDAWPFSPVDRTRSVLPTGERGVVGSKFSIANIFPFEFILFLKRTFIWLVETKKRL